MRGVAVDQQVQRERWIDATAQEVWAAVTTDGWLAAEVRLELAPGGEASFRDGEEERSGWVEEARAPVGDGEGRLAFWWAATGDPASRVEITIDERGARTRVRITEARPLEVLDLVGLPLFQAGGRTFGPALVAA
jgi:hypothetical protein